MFQVCRALTLVARGDLELERVLDGSASQKQVVKYADTTWEVVIPDGESYGFNVQTWCQDRFSRSETDTDGDAKAIGERVGSGSCYSRIVRVEAKRVRVDD